MLGLVNAYKLHLVELMEAVQTSYVLAVRTCLTTETSRVSTSLNRKLLLIEDNVTEDVCYGHLSSRDEVEVVQLTLIHLCLLVRQLTCAVARSLVHYERRLYLQISALASLIKEECLERTLQTSHLSDVYWESGTCNLNAKVEVDKIEFLAEIPMAESVFRKIRNYATLLNHYVVAGILAFGYVVVRNVRNGAELCYKILLCLSLDFFQLFVGFLYIGHFCLYAISLFFLAFLHQTSNLCCHFLGFRKITVQFLLCLATTKVDGENFLDGFFGIREMLFVQSLDNTFSFLTDEFKCKHMLNS